MKEFSKNIEGQEKSSRPIKRRLMDLLLATERIDLPRKRKELSTGRHQGKLEKMYAKTPLPPTPITDRAKSQLEGWGILPEEIDQLREMTSSFRYDLCGEKAERIAENGGEIHREADGSETIVLPNFFNFTDRFDGQCGDLSAQTRHLLDATNFLPRINNRLKGEGRPPLKPYFVSGLSRTHFINEGNKHFWIGVRPESETSESSIIIDPSFQEITTREESGYTQQDPERTNFTPFELAHFETVKVGKITKDAQDRYSCDIPQPPIIGVSTDRQLAYSLGFFKDAQENICPAIVTLLPDGKSFSSYPTADGSIRSDGEHLLTEGQQTEIEKILQTIQKMPLTKAPERVHETAPVYEKTDADDWW